MAETTGKARVVPATAAVPDGYTLSRWKAKIPAGELQRLASKKGDRADDAVFDCVSGNLKSLTAQAEAAGDPEYVRKQSARDLAMLYGVMFDKSMLLLQTAGLPHSD